MTEFNNKASEGVEVQEGINTNFSTALNCLKDGMKMSRRGWWNDKDMFIFLVPGSSFKVNRAPLLGIYPEGTIVTYNAHIDMRHRDGYVTPWTPTQTDMLGTDWYIIE